MVKFIKIRNHGDYTCEYGIELDRLYTVSEFVNSIINHIKDEFGYIGIDNGIWYSPGAPYCEYKYGVLLSNLPEDILSRKVSSAKSIGGLGRMDYKLVLKDLR